ncbi:MAG: YggS family pyridoxal phosphate-dependent enzyme [Candidatus Margulisiibacteriota bacterium]
MFKTIDEVKGVISQYKVVPDVRLVAVTKTLSTTETEKAIQSGLNDLGENRVQIAEKKILALSATYHVTWHYIGSIQKNKVKKIVELFDVIHSVDSWDTLGAINSQSEKTGRRPEILLEVNVSGETSKHGFTPQDIRMSVRTIPSYKYVQFKGYMTMAPFTQDGELIRSVFRGLKALAEEMKTKQGISYDHLSMGMSQDYKIALEEGATMVRLGSALFSKGGEEL